MWASVQALVPVPAMPELACREVHCGTQALGWAVATGLAREISLAELRGSGADLRVWRFCLRIFQGCRTQ